jgi:hypothetical protein
LGAHTLDFKQAIHIAGSNSSPNKISIYLDEAAELKHTNQGTASQGRLYLSFIVMKRLSDAVTQEGT